MLLRQPLLLIACLAGLWHGATYAQQPMLAYCKELVASGNSEYPPFLWRDPHDEGRLIGANAELMQELAEEIGIPIRVSYVGPWGRVQEEARLGRIDLIAGAFFTLPRLEYMDYVYPAIRNTRTVIWTRDRSKFTYRKWSDLRPLRGITVINNSFGEAFDRYAKRNLSIHAVPSVESALRMLTLARGDYVIYEEAPGQAYAAKLGLKGIHPSQTAISNEDLLLTISHKSPCNTGEVRGRLARAMHKLTEAGRMDALLVQYIQRWRDQNER